MATGLTELAHTVAARTGSTVTAAHDAIEAAFDEIAAALKAGNEVRLPGLCTLKVRETMARQGRNPATGEPMVIPAQRRVVLKQSSVIRAALNPKAPSVPRGQRRS